MLIIIGLSFLYKKPDNAKTFERVPVLPKNFPDNSLFTNLLANVPLTPIIESVDSVSYTHLTLPTSDLV